MNDRVAWMVGILAGWGGYTLARAIVREFDIAAWKDAWNAIPAPTRDMIRDSLLDEEGITDGR
jgi:hypothetical protein